MREGRVSFVVRIPMASGAPELLHREIGGPGFEGEKRLRQTTGPVDWAVVVAEADWQVCAGARCCLFAEFSLDWRLSLVMAGFSGARGGVKVN